MRILAACVVLTARVINHANVGHAALGTRAPIALLTNTRRIQTDISGGVSFCITLPIPRPILVEGRLVVKQPREAFAGGLRDPLDGRLAQSQSAQLAQRDLGGLRAGWIARRRCTPLRWRRA